MFNKNQLLKASNCLWDQSRDDYSKSMPNEDAYKDIMDYRQLHSKVVADLALEMYNSYFKIIFPVQNNLFEPSLYLACLIHDTKKLTPKHNLAGANFIKNNFALFESLNLDLALVVTIVKYHTASKKRNDDDYFREILDLSNEIKILLLFTRLSDKLSKLVIKSAYKEITNSAVDEIINKTVRRSEDLMAAYSDITSIINDISQNFKRKYCETL